MSEFKIYKDQIEPYKYLLIERVRDVQTLLRDRNRLLASNGVSYIPVFAEDLVEACRNLLDVVPPDTIINTSDLEHILSEIKTITYEDLLDPERQPAVIAKMEELAEKAHKCLRNIMMSLFSKGLLLRSKKRLGAVEE